MIASGVAAKPLSRPGRGWPEGPGEGRARIIVLIPGGTLTLPPLRGGPLPLPGRERGGPRRRL
ncbi:hypothetical protein D3867_15505 (plasmid) [Azospirillum argentinense]|uniref:Uncharacterized protein n=1 Tax=Azospirillum brasilense TaxID=192 RepID=A0A4D8QBF0_AZOBR|nr:hypothetical protein D3867_15505 [Azospirillum argentinense]